MNDSQLILLCRQTAQLLDRVLCELERREKREQLNAGRVGWLSNSDLKPTMQSYLNRQYEELKREMEFTDWLMQPQASPENTPHRPPVSRKPVQPRLRTKRKSGTRAGS